MTKLWNLLPICLFLLCSCGSIPKEGTIRNIDRKGTFQDPNEITIPIGSSDPRHMEIERELFYLLEGM